MSSLVSRIMGPSGGLRHQIATAMAGTFILNLISKLMMLVTTMLLARLMGPRNYGVYASAVAVVTLVGVPASLGLPNLLVREVAICRARKTWGSMKGLLLRASQAEVSITILLALVLWGLQYRFGASKEFTESLIWLTFILLPLTQFNMMRMAVLRGLHHIVLGLVPETVIMPSIFIFVVLILGIFPHLHITPLEAIIARLVAVVSAFTVGAAFLFAKLPGDLRRIKPDYHIKQWVRATGPLMWVGAMSIITMQTDVVMLAALRGPSDAGIYQVAARAAELVAFVSMISNITLQPTLARLNAQGDMAKLKQVTRLVTRIMFGSAFLAAVVFISAGSELLKLFYGVAYTSGAVALDFLSIGWTIVALTGPARDTLIMTGGEKAVAISISVAATLNVVLNFLLIPRFGTAGAAIATAISLIACNIGYASGVRRRLGFWILAI